MNRTNRIKSTEAYIRSLGLTVKHTDGEFRVAYPLSHYAGHLRSVALVRQEDQAYYTDSCEDAAAKRAAERARSTARAQARLHKADRLEDRGQRRRDWAAQARYDEQWGTDNGYDARIEQWRAEY